MVLTEACKRHFLFDKSFFAFANPFEHAEGISSSLLFQPLEATFLHALFPGHNHSASSLRERGASSMRHETRLLQKGGMENRKEFCLCCYIREPLIRT